MARERAGVVDAPPVETIAETFEVVDLSPEAKESAALASRAALHYIDRGRVQAKVEALRKEVGTMLTRLDSGGVMIPVPTILTPSQWVEDLDKQIDTIVEECFEASLNVIREKLKGARPSDLQRPGVLEALRTGLQPPNGRLMVKPFRA